MSDEEPWTLPDGHRPRFRRRTLLIDPGDCRPYLASDWHDCLVVIESGEIELEATSGARLTCRGGDVLWLAGLPLRRLSNHGHEPVVITMVRRWQDGSRTEPEERQ